MPQSARAAPLTWTDRDIEGPTRTCEASGRELKPGDRFHAVLVEKDGKLVRIDYMAEAWPGPPAEAVAHWSGRVPAAGKPRKPEVNEEVLLGCFDRLRDATEPESLNFRYVAALLLMQRKRLRFEDVEREGAGRDVLLLKDPRSRTVHRVLDPRLTDEQVAAVQTEVFRVLGWE